MRKGRKLGTVRSLFSLANIDCIKYGTTGSGLYDTTTILGPMVLSVFEGYFPATVEPLQFEALNGRIL